MAIDEAIKDMVSFRLLNLTHLPHSMTGPLQAIFCHEGLVPLVVRLASAWQGIQRASRRGVPAVYGP